MTYERKEVLSVKNGEALRLEIDEMPTSGYMWAVENAGGVEIQRVPMNEAQLGSRMIGGGMTAVFNIKAPGPGTYNIDLVESRPWEDRVHGRVRYTLNVRP